MPPVTPKQYYDAYSGPGYFEAALRKAHQQENSAPVALIPENDERVSDVSRRSDKFSGDMGGDLTPAFVFQQVPLKQEVMKVAKLPKVGAAWASTLKHLRRGTIGQQGPEADITYNYFPEKNDGANLATLLHERKHIQEWPAEQALQLMGLEYTPNAHVEVTDPSATELGPMQDFTTTPGVWKRARRQK